MKINLAFTNFWDSFYIHDFWFYKILQELKIEINIVSIDQADIICASLFGDKLYLLNILHSTNKPILLFSLENLYHPNHRWVLKELKYFHTIFGLNYLTIHNSYRIPYYIYNYYNNINIQHFNNYIEKSKNLSLVSSNPHPLRLSIFKKFKEKNIHVDCPGAVCQNMKPFGSSQNLKLNFLQDYIFNICPENSYATGYTTEKIFDALNAGCIPIYWGNLQLDKNILNLNKILVINKNLSNIDHIINRCIYLLNHKDMLKKILHMKPYNSCYHATTDSAMSKLKSYIIDKFIK